MIVYEVMTMEQLRQLAAPSNWVGVVVDFYADWCGPCQKLKPWFAQLAADPRYSDRVLFVKCNTDLLEGEMLNLYPVRALPTVLFLNRNLEIMDKVTGMNTEAIEVALNTMVELANTTTNNATIIYNELCNSGY